MLLASLFPLIAATSSIGLSGDVQQKVMKVYVLQRCPACHVLKKNLDDPAVKEALKIRDISVQYVEGPVPGVNLYPHVVLGDRSFTGAKTSDAIIAWLRGERHRSSFQLGDTISETTECCSVKTPNLSEKWLHVIR
jgi:hypothetical protein